VCFMYQLRLVPGIYVCAIMVLCQLVILVYQSCRRCRNCLDGLVVCPSIKGRKISRASRQFLTWSCLDPGQRISNEGHRFPGCIGNMPALINLDQSTPKFGTYIGYSGLTSTESQKRTYRNGLRCVTVEQINEKDDTLIMVQKKSDAYSTGTMASSLLHPRLFFCLFGICQFSITNNCPWPSWYYIPTDVC